MSTRGSASEPLPQRPHGRPRPIRAAWQRASDASAFGSRVLLTVGTNGLLAVLFVVTGSFAARLLGPSGRGELAAVQTWPTFLTTIALFGVPDALVYFSARFRGAAGSYLGSALALGLLGTIPFMIAGYVAMPYVLGAQTPQIVAEARAYLLILPITTAVGMAGHALRGRNDLVYWNALRFSPTLGWLAILAIAWSLGQRQPGFVATGYLMMLTLLIIPVMLVAHRRLPGPFKPKPKLWPPMLRFALPSALGNVPKLINVRLDQMLLAAFFPPVMLGVYIVALSWSRAVHPLLSALGAAVFPHVAAAEGTERSLGLSRGMRLGLVLAAAVAAMLLALTPAGVPLLFGEDYRAAVSVGLLLVVAESAAGFNHIVEEGIRGFGEPKRVIWAEFSGLGVTCIVLLLLLRPLGVMGAAIAALSSQITVAAILAVQARRLTGEPLRALLLPRPAELRLVLQRTIHVSRAIFRR